MSDHPAQVSITLDGRPHTVPRGRSLAAALIATDHPVTRHDRAGRPRAPYCGMGVCFDCAVTVDGIPLVRACQEPVRAGMRVDTGGGVGTGVRVDTGCGVDTRARDDAGAEGREDVHVDAGPEVGRDVRLDADRGIRADGRSDTGHKDGPGLRLDTDPEVRADVRGDTDREDV
ncbi:(2Fe-2S)-binding protein [Embleya scabrispora]|uniref:(2Fe-2S)-binding protein n=1 Tax=Embleya scabrispora TaxID=159449 RepID=UPI0003A8E7BB|nr:(2Fe-2S)-binding protein [Embleya scabrispora]MYS83884.1 hypothetical protein [Streptomyces sp. SID5474]